MEKGKTRIIIQRIQDLPTLPTTILQIIKVVESKGSSAQDLADVVSKDQSISSMLLRLVNSAFYGHLRQISSISHAVVILGYQTVKTMALGVSVFSSSSPKTGKGFNRNLFWAHSLGVASFSKRIFNSLPSPGEMNSDTLFLSGLLHDIGKVVFDNYFNEEYGEAIEEARREGEWIGLSEARTFDMDHSEAGYHLARKWQFPQPVIDSIRFHHRLDECPKESMVIASIVHVADSLCRQIELGSGGDTVQIEINELAMKTLNIDEEVLEKIIQEVEVERESIESFVMGAS